MLVGGCGGTMYLTAFATVNNCFCLSASDNACPDADAVPVDLCGDDVNHGVILVICDCRAEIQSRRTMYFRCNTLSPTFYQSIVQTLVLRDGLSQVEFLCQRR